MSMTTSTTPRTPTCFVWRSPQSLDARSFVLRQCKQRHRFRNGIDPNSSEESSMKPPAGDETINAEGPRAAQDRETSLKMRAEIPMFLSEPTISTSSSSKRLSEYMLEL